MKPIIAFISLLLLITSCNKSKDPTFVYDYSNPLVEYRISMTNNWVTDYSKYVNNALAENTIFVHMDSIITKTTTDVDGIKMYNGTYYLGNNNFAKSSVDTSFNLNGNFIVESVYDYENEFLTKHSYNYFNTSGPDSGFVDILYVIENENIKSKNTQPNGSTPGCTDRYNYYSGLNMMDITGFNNEILGKNCNKLKESEILNGGCPSGPSSSLAYSTYTYEVNNSGYVIKMTRTYTPSYHITTAIEVRRVVYVTTYEYNFQ